MDHQINGIALPNDAGFFGNYGGQFIPPHLKEAMDDINLSSQKISKIIKEHIIFFIVTNLFLSM